MANGCIAIGEALSGFRGVLTGVPVWTGSRAARWKAMLPKNSAAENERVLIRAFRRDGTLISRELGAASFWVLSADRLTSFARSSKKAQA